MTTCLFHGGFTRKDNDLNRAFYKDFASRIPDGGTILYVYFASRDEVEHENPARFAEHQAFVMREAGDKTFVHRMAELATFVEEAKKADAIFINGGNPEKLMRALRSLPDFKALMQGKVVAGSSSGAYALSSYYYSITPEAGVYDGFGVAPVKVICHYESESEEHVRGKEAEEALASYPGELVIVHDYEHKTIVV